MTTARQLWGDLEKDDARHRLASLLCNRMVHERLDPADRHRRAAGLLLKQAIWVSDAAVRWLLAKVSESDCMLLDWDDVYARDHRLAALVREIEEAGLLRRANVTPGQFEWSLPLDVVGACLTPRDSLRPLREPYFEGDAPPEPWLTSAAAADIEASRTGLVGAREALFAAIFAAFGKCESPIERVMLAALLERAPSLFAGEGTFPSFDIGGAQLMLQHELRIDNRTRRLDFALIDEVSDVRLAIEADGYEYHERTPEDAVRDRAKVRDLGLAGFGVVPFLGREILQEPLRCADHVYHAHEVGLDRAVAKLEADD